jgi:hypothetical protein
MAADNFVYPKLKVFQLNSTQVAAGAKIYTYEAGTSTDKATYSDQALTSANANPVIADSNGEATIWLKDDGLYKIVINDSDDVLICSFDNVGPYETAATSTAGKYNLVSNGSFETNTGDNGTPEDWTLSITSGTIQIDQATQTHGLSCLEFNDGGSGAGSATSDFFPVEASSELRTRLSMKASTSTTGNKVQILWYDKDQNAASTASTDILDITASVPTSWTEYILVATAGSDVAYAKIRLLGSTTAGISYYDNIVVSQREQEWVKGEDITAAATLTLGNDGNYFDVTGATGITAISARPTGTHIRLHFDSTPTLTHHATNLIIPNATSITMEANDELELYYYGSGWRVTNINRYNGIQSEDIDASAIATTNIADEAVTEDKLGPNVSAWALLGHTSTTGAAAITFESVFDSTYDEYILLYSKLAPVTDAEDLLVQVALSGTPTSYETTNYGGVVFSQESADTALASRALTSTGWILSLSAGSTAASNETTDGMIILHDPALNLNTQHPRITINQFTVNNLSDQLIEWGYGRYNSTTSIVSLRIVSSSGNVEGTASLFGVKRS